MNTVVQATVLAVALTTVNAGVADPDQQDMSPAAHAYLVEALDIMQANSLLKRKVDWASLRHEALEQAAGAQEPVDTYQAIRFALEAIGDNHSFLQLIPALAEKEAARRGTPAKAKTEHGGRPSSPYLARTAPELVLHRDGQCVVPQVVVPRFGSQAGDAFASELQALFERADAGKPCGWIIDLRGNAGGNVFPMIAGVGPLLGDVEAVYSVDAEGERTGYFYRQGRAGLKYPDGSEVVITTVEGEPYYAARELPIAVLIDGLTASSGEFIAIAFRDLPGTRFFGEHTYGASTANQGFLLSDGANIVLTVGVVVGRSGRTYYSGVSPDEKIDGGAEILPASEDPVVRAALAWLYGQVR